MKTQQEILMEAPEFRKLLAVETLVLQASELIATLMAERKMSKADLARLLNKSRAWVTQLLSGRANITVRTLAEVVHALESEVVLHARSPHWQGSARTKQGSSSGQIVFKMESYTLGQPVVAANFFQLETDRLTNASDDVLCGSDDPVRPGYAA
jgi:transcriptional regulator with XRE-family HTH domain